MNKTYFIADLAPNIFINKNFHRQSGKGLYNYLRLRFWNWDFPEHCETELWNTAIVNRAECTLSVKALFTSPRYEAMEIEFQYNEIARYLVPLIYTYLPAALVCCAVIWT